MGIFSKKKDVIPPPPPPPPPPTVKEVARKNKRDIDRAIRELDRERAKLETQEKQCQMNIKKAAKDGEMESARIMAKELVRTRQMKGKMYTMKTQMQTVSMQLTTMTTSQMMSGVMGGVVQAVSMMNTQMDLPAMQHIAMEYEKQFGKMEMTQEVMNDTFDGMFAGQEEEESKVIDAVMEEVVLETAANIGTSLPTNTAPGQKVNNMPEDLASRLDDLRPK